MLLLFSLVVAFALAWVPAAQASPETFRRSVSNLIFFPLDLLLSPAVAGNTLVTNLRDIDDSPGVRVAYAVPGYFWLLGLEAGGSMLRGITGVIELLPGIVLYPFENTDMTELYDLVSKCGGMVEWENPLAEHEVGRWIPIANIDVKFGINYQSHVY